MVLLAAAVIAVVGIVASQDDDDDDSGNAITDLEATAQPATPGDATHPAETGDDGDSPEQVAVEFVDTVRNQDCEAMLELVSQEWLASLGAGEDEQLARCAQSLGDVVPSEFVVTDSAVTTQEGEHATVTITAEVPGGTDTLDLDLVREDGVWKVEPSTVAETPASASPSAATPGG